ncbi:MAG: hypothetical protein AAGG38_14060 [Planctomycetota bacterium]
MISDMFNSGAMPVLERMVQFTGARHGVIADNIANLSTPHFRPRDLNPHEFQQQLRQAVDRRRATASPIDGPLDFARSEQLTFHADRLEARPQPLDENILFHDRNNRDLERIMQDLAENTAVHNVSIQLMRSEMSIMQTAIRETIR